MEKNVDKYSSAEKRAYYMGFGVGRCGLSIHDDKVQNMICYTCKDDKTSVSMIRGVMDGELSLKRKNKGKYSPKGKR